MVTVVVSIPEGLRAPNREYAIVRVHDGKAELLRDEDSAAETLTFRTNVFSSYTIVYREGTASSTPPTATAQPVSPSAPPAAPATGDDAPLALYGTMFMLCAAGLVLMRVKKRRGQ